MSLTTELVAGVWALESTAITANTRTATLDLLLDHIGVAAIGSTTASAKAIQAFLGDTGEAAAIRMPVAGTSSSLGGGWASITSSSERTGAEGTKTCQLPR